MQAYKPTCAVIVTLALTLTLGGCDDKGAAPTPAPSAKPAPTPTQAAMTTKATAAPTPTPSAAATASAAAAAPAGDLSTPKGSIQHQVNLLNDGKVEELKACFTDRQKDKVTPEAVAKGKEEFAKAKMSIDDMVHKIEEGEADGKKTAKIRMKVGNLVLTTLILTDGKWLADTIWFK